jgi:RimJ/RimL family protein N-acetyltransferase
LTVSPLGYGHDMAELPFPDPSLSAGPLALRAWTAEDLPAVVAACQDPAIARFAAAIPATCSEADTRAWFASQEPARRAGLRLELAITNSTSDALLGSIALSSVERVHGRAMVSFWVAPQARGQGVAAQALWLLAGWAFGSLGLARLELFIEPDNAASQRVAERCGFVREGLLRSRWVSTGRRRDSVVYGLLAEEFRERRIDSPPAPVTKLEQALAGHPRVVIVNGPAGVGKTTTARSLAAMARSGACVHGDDLKGFIVRRDAPVATGLGYRNGATVAGNFIAGGYDLVVFDYVFEDPAGIEVFLDAYTAAAPVHLFTLWADLPTVLAREAQRHDTRRPLGDRVRACHATMASHLDELGEVLDTSRRDARIAAAEICRRACAGSGLIHPGSEAALRAP